MWLQASLLMSSSFWKNWDKMTNDEPEIFVNLKIFSKILELSSLSLVIFPSHVFVLLDFVGCFKNTFKNFGLVLTQFCCLFILRLRLVWLTLPKVISVGFKMSSKVLDFPFFIHSCYSSILCFPLVWLTSQKSESYKQHQQYFIIGQ